MQLTGRIQLFFRWCQYQHGVADLTHLQETMALGCRADRIERAALGLTCMERLNACLPFFGRQRQTPTRQIYADVVHLHLH